MKRPSLRFLSSRKFWQRSAFALACLATLIVAAYAIENYRGEKVWSEYRAAAQARGVKLDFKDFIPPPIPDEENFAAIQIYRDLLSGDPAVRERARKAVELPVECTRFVGQGEPVDFPALGKCMVESSLLATTSDDPVADVFRGLERYESVLTQLRQGASRPRSRLNGEWEKGFDAAIWRMGNVVSIGQVVSLRVSALLEKGRGREALLDWHAGYRHAGVFQGEPTLLACMIRVVLVSVSTESLRRGLTVHAWSEDELKAISQDLASIDLLSDFTLGMSSERALINSLLDQMRGNPSAWSHFIGYSANPGKLKPIPVGWIAQNQRHLNEWYDEQIARIGTPQERSALKIQPPNLDQPKNWIRFPYWFVASAAAFTVGENVVVCREVQTKVDLCLTACALERFHLRHGHYPQDLRELIPVTLAALPRDRFDGQPLRYRRTDDGGAMVYSTGRNHSDHGGDDAKDSVLRLRPNP